MTTDTSTSVVTVEANLSNYGSGAGVQHLLDTTNQAINSLPPGNNGTLVNDGTDSVIVNYKPYIAFRLTGNAMSTTVNLVKSLRQV